MMRYYICPKCGYDLRIDKNRNLEVCFVCGFVNQLAKKEGA